MSLAISLDVIDELAELLGRAAVLSARSDLVVYECDGFVIEKNCPDVVVFPRTTEDVAGDRANLQRNGAAVRAARGGHQPGRRLSAGRRRRDDRPDADEADSGNQSPRSLCRGRNRAWSTSGSPML